MGMGMGGNGNNFMGMGGNGNSKSHSRTPLAQTNLETIVCKFGGDPAICLVEEAICAKRLQTDGRTTDAARLH